MSVLGGLAFLVGSAVWLVILIVTGFSLVAVSAGLLTALYLLNGFDGSAA